ncbi:MFS sugar transporter-like protein [Xylaria acuta]|nr:MFS sugar transporter-like protein [Xylaria acuta]
MVGAIIFILGGGLQTATQKMNYLYAGRALAGVGVGFLTMIIRKWPSLQPSVTHRDSQSMTDLASITVHRSEEGLATLARLHSGGGINDFLESITDEHEKEAKSYVELSKNKSAFRRLFLAFSIQASIYVLALVAQFCCLLTVDKFGRRPVLISENLVNCLTFIVVAVLLGFATDNITSTWIFNISFSYACGPLPWQSQPGSSIRIRSKDVSIATMTSFYFNTLIGQVTEIAVEATGWRYFLLFVIANEGKCNLLLRYLPEAKPPPLEEMNYLFTHAPWIAARVDPQKYRANVERRAEETREKADL